jgi:carboxypeptidase Taq
MNLDAPLLHPLLDTLRVITDLESARAVLEWDQSTYMPEGGAEARGRQIALLGRLAHERKVSPSLRAHLDAARDHEDADDEVGALLRRARTLHERATRIPPDLVDAIGQHSAASYVTWTKARPANDFALMRPYLERTIELSRRVSACFPEGDHLADPLLDEQDPGMTVARVRRLFAGLREGLRPLLDRIFAHAPPDRAFLEQRFDRGAQLAFGRQVIERLGYDFRRGRQDETHHPFMTRFAAGDVRITTRIKDDDLAEALFSTIHEAGHALYEQNIDPRYDGTPLGQGVSAGVHESQSRLWENLVARSRPFWAHFYPALQSAFPGALDGVSLDDFYRAINRVERSLIRTDADEVTYNLHVMLRFELETQMLEGALAVKDLPEAWNARMEEDLGVRPPSDRDGCLQDVHWYCTTVGGTFQGYTLGNLIAAQVYEAAERAIPGLEAKIEAGDFDALRAFLVERIYRHGARYEPEALVQKATLLPLSAEPFLRHLRRKYEALYPAA